METCLYMPLTPAPRRQRQRDLFSVRGQLVYKARSSTARAIQRNTVSKNQKNKIKNSQKSNPPVILLLGSEAKVT